MIDLPAEVFGVVGVGVLLFAARHRGTEVSVLDVLIRDLGSEFDGYTIVALSDLHYAPGANLAAVRHAVSVANASQPDLIVLLGDYGWSLRRMPRLSQRWYREALTAITPECQRLQARDGVVAVLGNHDYYAGADYVRGWLGEIGATVLVNRARRIMRSSSALRVAGMDDLSEGSIDAHVGCEPADRFPTVVLSHNPDGIARLATDLRVDLVLAGHTHGGQIVIPGYGAPFTMARTCGPRSASGWVANPRAPLYVTRGLGAQLPLPIRVNCRPEIVVLRLRSPHQQPA